MTEFKSLDLPDSVFAALAQMKVRQPTPIQVEAIPAILNGRDLIGSAQTGTGKTLAFALPVLIHLLNSPDRMALILVPTRELGVQIVEVFKALTVGLSKLKVMALIGGKSMKSQKSGISEQPSILVATPGRLFDHLKHENVNLESMKILVLDEADRMLDMGFLPQVQRILSSAPAKRQNLIFSATLPPVVVGLAKQILKNPVTVTVGPKDKAADKIIQLTREVTSAGRDDALLDELNAREGSAIVFVKTREQADTLTEYLKSYGYLVSVIHGERSQARRQAAIEGLRNGQLRVVVATDVAARGLDIPQIALVINYELPYSAEDYIHRVGRTGRAGVVGESLTFITPENKHRWEIISQVLSGKKRPPSKPNPKSGYKKARPSEKSKKEAARRPAVEEKKIIGSKKGPVGKSVVKIPKGSGFSKKTSTKKKPSRNR